MIVISDTSPILNLARVHRLDLLPALYGQVVIPSAVDKELTGANNETRRVIELALNSWLTVDTPQNQELVLQLCRNIDAGEAEAIVLAVERQAGLLLIDEKLGRDSAKAFGLRIIGLLGVLAEAKQTGLIERVKPVLDELISEARFWVAPNLYWEILTTVGEI